MADDAAAFEQAQASGRLHADLALWEQAHRLATNTREQTIAGDQAKRLDAVTRAYWTAFVARMERHAQLLGSALKTPTTE
jgi:hypothetical protein